MSLSTNTPLANIWHHGAGLLQVIMGAYRVTKHILLDTAHHEDEDVFVRWVIDEGAGLPYRQPLMLRGSSLST